MGSNLQKTIEKYDVECNEWRVVHTTLSVTRYGRSVVSFENRYIYIFGGEQT